MADKIQQEIEELLAKLDTFPPPKPWHVRLRESIGDAVGSVFEALGRIPFPRLNPGHVVLIAIAVIVAAYFMYDNLGNVARWIILGAILAFVAAFVMSLRRQSSRFSGPGGTKYWRDRPIDLSKPGPDWKNRRHRR